MNINPEFVRRAVAKIEATKGDDEVAHGMEDHLHFTILAAIASGTIDDPVECARIAITTDQIDFARRCA